MKIAIAGLGYVGLSNAVLLAQHNEVVAVDIAAEKVAMLNRKQSPIEDAEIEDYLQNKPLNLRATLRQARSLRRCRLRHHRHPDRLRPRDQLLQHPIDRVCHTRRAGHQPAGGDGHQIYRACGLHRQSQASCNANLIFSPEFLREGKALYDNLHPSRIVVGDRSQWAARPLPACCSKAPSSKT